ncbi:MAG: hypothetical protein WCN98_19755, partial [Verrucomicrobiaceae bacterium]
MQQMDKADHRSLDAAWRHAVEIWLRCQNLISLTTNQKCHPIYNLNCYHSLLGRTISGAVRRKWIHMAARSSSITPRMGNTWVTNTLLEPKCMSDKSNKVYLIERAFPEDDRDVTRLLIRYNPTQGVSMFDVFRGMPLTRKYFQNFDVKVDMQGDLYDCLPGNLSWLFVSPRTIQLLEKLGATGWKTYDLKLGELNSTLK